jgi:hypothetical protein
MALGEQVIQVERLLLILAALDLELVVRTR